MGEIHDRPSLKLRIGAMLRWLRRRLTRDGRQLAKGWRRVGRDLGAMFLEAFSLAARGGDQVFCGRMAPCAP
jgi:hypothetical protein